MKRLLLSLLAIAAIIYAAGCQGVFMNTVQSPILDQAILDSDGVQSAVKANAVTKDDLVKAVDAQAGFWQWVISERVWMSANYYILVGQSAAYAEEARRRAPEMSVDELKRVYAILNGYLHRLANARDGIAGKQPPRT
jgi:hypothetical protein